MLYDEFIVGKAVVLEYNDADVKAKQINHTLRHLKDRCLWVLQKDDAHQMILVGTQKESDLFSSERWMTPAELKYLGPCLKQEEEVKAPKNFNLMVKILTATALGIVLIMLATNSYGG